MTQARRHRSPALKREAVAFVVEHGYSCAPAGRRVGTLPSSTFHRLTNVQLTPAFPGSLRIQLFIPMGGSHYCSRRYQQVIKS